MTASPHFQVREDWLALSVEEVLDPEQPILDAHHHLWDRPGSRYRVVEFIGDVHSGHAVRASLFVQCRTGYRETGPEALRPLGEIETIRDWSASSPQFPAGIVGFADMQLGADCAPVLDALAATAGQGRLVGIRNTTAYHPDPRLRSNPLPAPDGLLRSDAFLAAARELARRGLVLDIWAYQSQLDEVAAIARAVPDLCIVLDHCGGPLGRGDYHLDDPESFAHWRDGLARVAALPNTHIKIGGFGLDVMGRDYAWRPTPPHSCELARDWAAHVETCVALFGTERAMFESNFPVDKGQFSYRALWNAFKRLCTHAGEAERADLFWRSAQRIYGLDPELMKND